MKKSNIYDDALALATNKKGANLSKISKMLEDAHYAGDKRATYALATWYLHGKYYDENEKTAFNLLLRATSSNEVPDAHMEIAVCYENGYGTDINEEKAFFHYLIAAVWGCNEAVFEVGRCFYYGIGVIENKKIGNIWFDKAEYLGLTRDN